VTIVSYAQNYEDVMLLRALRGVECGFYIDVGAQDPINDSVTKMFYEQGWRGINIEPVSHWYERLLADRPQDINLQLAVSDAPGQLRLFEVKDSGLSTTDLEFAQQHVQAGLRIRESDVSCVTLDHICEVHGVRDVHFLKIDCEGAEAAALRGISLNRVRPWIILLEATEPNSQKPAYEEWELLLTQRGYRFVYADGLNRFYLADERAELYEAFAYPPNVFDEFVRAPEAAAKEGLRHVSAENERRETALIEFRQALAQADERLRHEAILRIQEIAARDHEIGRLNAAFQAMHRSTSWRVTAPLRALARAVRILHRAGSRLAYQILRWPARLVRPLLRRIVLWRWLRSLAVGFAGSESRIVVKARLFLFGAPLSAHAQAAILPEAPLTRSAIRVLEVIEQVRKQK
jgi:FkbM family methyltransferase